MSSLCGSWRVASPNEPAVGLHGLHTYYFDAGGVLIQSGIGQGNANKCLLTWREEVDQLIIDQPSAPREDRLKFQLASEKTLCVNGSWYLREEPGTELDPTAPRWAFVIGALWHGVASAHAGEPFIPFLIFDTGNSRQLERVVTESAAKADEYAMKRLVASPFKRAIWIRDGRLVRSEGKIDAVLGALYSPGPKHESDFGLPYTFDDQGVAHPQGAVETFAAQTVSYV